MSDWAEEALNSLLGSHKSSVLLPALIIAPVLLLFVHWRGWLLDLASTFQRDAFYHLAGFGRPNRHKPPVDIVATFESTVAALPEKACFVADDEVWTFSLVADLVTRLAEFFASRLPVGAVIGVAVRPSPLHTALWLAAAKAGCSAVLIDAEDPGDVDVDVCLRRRRLRQLSALVYEAEAELALLSALPLLRHLKLLLSSHGEPGKSPRLPGALRLEAELLDAQAETPTSPTKPPARRRLDAPLLTVSEAGRRLQLTHADYLQLAAMPRLLLELGRQDILYICQPMNTALATAAGIGLTITEGVTCVLRSDCSPIGYWTDCARYGCTAGLYDGFLAAELTRRPKRPTDRLHSTTRLLGRGLSANSRRLLTAERFNLEELVELGGACAGAPGFMASDNLPSEGDEGGQVTVGFWPMWLPGWAPLRLLRLSADTGLPVWGCQAGPGDIALPLFPCEDSLAAAAAAAELPNRLADVFRPGDAWRHWLGTPLVVGRRGGLTELAAPPVHQSCYWRPGDGAAHRELKSILCGLLPECQSCCQLSCIATQPEDEGHLAAGEVVYKVSSRRAIGFPEEVASENSIGDAADSLDESCRRQLGTRIRQAFESRLPCYARPRVLRVDEARSSGGAAVIGQYEVCPDTGELLQLSDTDYRLLKRDLQRLWRSTD